MGCLTASWPLLLAAALNLCSCDQTRTLYFSFVTAHSEQYTALGAVPAIDLALERINKDSTILPGYNLSYTNVGNSLVLHVASYKSVSRISIIQIQGDRSSSYITGKLDCDQTASLDTFFSRLRFFNSSQPKYVSMLCCGCSVAAIPVAEISHHWNIPQMAYAAASLTLNNRPRFRSFFRTMPVYTNMGAAVAELAEVFNWEQLAVITQSNGLFVPVLESLEEIATANDLRLHSYLMESVQPLPYDELFNWGNEDYRIVFINAYRVPTRDVACEAYKRGLYGPRFVWITVNWGQNWWIPPSNHNCTVEQIMAVIDRGFSIIPRGFFIRSDKYVDTFSRITPEQFEDIYADRINETEYNFYSRYGLAYDAMWAIALGLNNTLTRINNSDTRGCEDVPGDVVPLEEFEYSNRKMGCLLRESYHQISFSGVTGDIMFNSNGSRISNIVTIRQNRMTESGDLTMEVAGLVSVAAQTSNSTFEYAEGESPTTVWPDSEGQPPYDGSAKDVVHPIALPLIIIYDILASFALLFAAACALFNIICRKEKVVKLSSPNLNYLICTGATLLFISVYLHNYTVKDLDQDSTVIQTVVCNFRQWLSSIGYTLCFAVILSKTWRIYYIFNNPLKKKKTIHDWVLFAIVGVVLSIDVLILILGTAIPQARLEASVTMDAEHKTADNSEGVLERRFIFVCANNAAIIWLSISYAYKGLLQLVAMFMAFHTRKVKIRALNDSKQIGAIVYINSIILVLLAVAELALRQYHYLYAALNGTILLIGGVLFLGLVFIPKMISLHKNQEGEDWSKASLAVTSVVGLDDVNTLKREIAELKAKINKQDEKESESTGEIDRS